MARRKRRFFDVWWFDPAKDRFVAVAWQLPSGAAKDIISALRDHGERATLTYSKTNPPNRRKPAWA